MHRTVLLRRCVALAILLFGCNGSLQIANAASAAELAPYCTRMFADITRARIQFRQATATIRRASYATLEGLAEFLLDCPDTRVRITGHTDSVGDAAYNISLSEERAKAIADYLVARGTDPGRLLTAGAGATHPLGDNATAYGRSLNRRIEFELLAAPD
jgi:outer membrane protein OmpA-like peptidoglycan-associated protein